MNWNEHVFAMYLGTFWIVKFPRMPIMRFIQKWRAEAAIFLVSAGAGDVSWDCFTERMDRRGSSKVHTHLAFLRVTS